MPKADQQEAEGVANSQAQALESVFVIVIVVWTLGTIYWLFFRGHPACVPHSFSGRTEYHGLEPVKKAVRQARQKRRQLEQETNERL